MKLSDRQVHIVNAFLRDAALETPSEPASARVKVLTHLRHQLREELARRNDSTLRDDELIRLLNRIQFPERAAIADAEQERRAKSVAQPTLTENGANGANGGNGHEFASPVLEARIESPKRNVSATLKSAAARRSQGPDQSLPSGPLASSQRIWLGACTALSERLDVAVERVRAGAIAVGLLAGPIAIVLYLAMYTFFYLGRYGSGAPRVNRVRVIGAVVPAVTGIAGMAVLFALSVWTIDFVHTLAIGYRPDLDQWGSFAEGVNRMLLMAAFIILPFAVLRGLPIAPPWDMHLPRLIRGAFAATASLVALALASYLTGALISGIRDWPA